MPGERLAPPERVSTVLTQEVKEFIAKYFAEDEQEWIRKQKHTAKRVYDRLVAEMGFTGGEPTISDYVRKYKNRTKEAFVPLVFPLGNAVQVDWGEVTSYIAGERIVVNIFCARALQKCRAFCYAPVTNGNATLQPSEPAELKT